MYTVEMTPLLFCKKQLKKVYKIDINNNNILLCNNWSPGTLLLKKYSVTKEPRKITHFLRFKSNFFSIYCGFGAVIFLFKIFSIFLEIFSIFLEIFSIFLEIFSGFLAPKIWKRIYFDLKNYLRFIWDLFEIWKNANFSKNYEKFIK